MLTSFYCFLTCSLVIIATVHAEEESPDNKAEPETQVADDNAGRIDFTDDFYKFGSLLKHEEFRLLVGGGASECFYENFTKNSRVFTNFEVLSGSDRNIDFIMAEITGEKLAETQWHHEGSHEIQLNNTGVVKFCFENYRGRFQQKLVLFYVIYFHAKENWNGLAKDASVNGTSSENTTYAEDTKQFPEYLFRIEDHVFRMKDHQATARMHAAADMSLQKRNHSYVQWWAVLQIVVILATATCQVVFVRRLFTVPLVTPSMKPRA